MRLLTLLVITYLLLSFLQLAWTLWLNFSLTSKIAGTVGVRVLQPCSIRLSEGWNLVSLCMKPDNLSISAILKDIDYRYVLRWNRSRQEFDIYSPRSSQNPFTEWDPNESYFIYYRNQTGWLEVAGEEFGDLEIPLLVGWNAPSYPYLFSTNISRYLSCLDYRYLMKWNTSQQAWTIFSPRATVKPFWLIYRGEGQFLLMRSDGVLKYNKSLLQS